MIDLRGKHSDEKHLLVPPNTAEASVPWHFASQLGRRPLHGHRVRPYHCGRQSRCLRDVSKLGVQGLLHKFGFKAMAMIRIQLDWERPMLYIRASCPRFGMVGALEEHGARGYPGCRLIEESMMVWRSSFEAIAALHSRRPSYGCELPSIQHRAVSWAGHFHQRRVVCVLQCLRWTDGHGARVHTQHCLVEPSKGKGPRRLGHL